jgi:antirestriction protein ArdC
MSSQTEIQQQITGRIIEGLKNGVVRWRRTWQPDKHSGAPTNLISLRPYWGINPILVARDLFCLAYVSHSKTGHGSVAGRTCL